MKKEMYSNKQYVKKTYSTPKREDYGTIQELTLGGGLLPGDAALSLIDPGSSS